jgi:hypothetical protein
MHITRRRALSYLSLVGFQSLSGCIGNIIQDDGTVEREICDLAVDNQDSKSYHGNLRIKSNSEVVFERRFELQGNQEGESSFSINEHLPIEGQSIEIQVKLDDGRTDSLEIDEEFSESTSVFITISRSELKLYFSSDCPP